MQCLGALALFIYLIFILPKYTQWTARRNDWEIENVNMEPNLLWAIIFQRSPIQHM
jgi:hypothetical protein